MFNLRCALVFTLTITSMHHHQRVQILNEDGSIAYGTIYSPHQNLMKQSLPRWVEVNIENEGICSIPSSDVFEIFPKTPADVLLEHTIKLALALDHDPMSENLYNLYVAFREQLFAKYSNVGIELLRDETKLIRRFQHVNNLQRTIGRALTKEERLRLLENYREKFPNWRFDWTNRGMFYCRMRKKKCYHCGEEGGKLNRCGRCAEVWYCGKECSEKGWEKHKPHCFPTCGYGTNFDSLQVERREIEATDIFRQKRKDQPI